MLIRRHSLGCFCVAATLLCGSTSGSAEQYALCVGVNQCPDFLLPDGSHPRPLRGAESDVDALATLLKEQFGFPAGHVQTLKGKEATREAIRAALAQLARTLRPEDNFVFHFSGHGTQVPDRKPLDEADGLDEALCPSDALANGEHLVLDDELALWLDDLPARRITVILDSCHSGSGIKDLDDDLASRWLPMAINSAARPPVAKPAAPKAAWRELAGTAKSLDRQMVALFACQPQQQAYERRLPGMERPARAGQFSYYLAEGLRGGRADADGDGVVTDREAFDYVSRRLDATFNAARTAATERQQPMLDGSAPRPLFGPEPPVGDKR